MTAGVLLRNLSYQKRSNEGRATLDVEELGRLEVERLREITLLRGLVRSGARSSERNTSTIKRSRRKRPLIGQAGTLPREVYGT